MAALLFPAWLRPGNRGWAGAVPVGSVLGVCAGLGVLSRDGVVWSTQSCCESCSLGEWVDARQQDGTPRAGRCPGDPGVLVASNALAGWLHAPGQGKEHQHPSHPLPVPCMFSSLDSCHPLLPPLLWDSPATSVLLVHTRHGAAWRAGSVHAHAQHLPVRPAPLAQPTRAPSSPWGDAGPVGLCCCVWCGCTPFFTSCPGSSWVAGQGAPSPGWRWVQAGWGWVTVIGLPAG